MKYRQYSSKVSLSWEEMEYIQVAIQPDIDKNDIGALELWRKLEDALKAMRND